MEIAVIFGAGDGRFPPRSVYGLDVVDDHLEPGWTSSTTTWSPAGGRCFTVHSRR